MRRVTKRVAFSANPREQVGAITGTGKTVKAAERRARQLLGMMNRGAAKPKPNPAPRRKAAKRKPLSFGQRMARIRARKKTARRRVKR